MGGRLDEVPLTCSGKIWGKIMAGCVLAAAPPVLIYAFLMDYYIAGLTAGATKG